MTTGRNTLLFGAALALGTVAVAADHITHPVQRAENPVAQSEAGTAGAAC